VLSFFNATANPQASRPPRCNTGTKTHTNR
jgi:hypothetical protein